MISPGLALSLALAGCGGSDYMAQMPRHDSGVVHDGGGALSDTPIYSAPMPDASGLDQGQDGAGIDMALGPDLDIDRPAVDTGNEAAARDSDESPRG